jgi:glyoxylase-like metal-dependent hydrolase (beta-lactamase superfamily II)
MRDAVHTDTAFDSLYALRAEPLPFDRSLLIRAFLLQRDPGNLLIYSTNDLQGRTAAIADVGGVERHYLNHWHEAMFARERVSAPLFVHENDSAQAGERTHVDETFSTRHAVDDDFEAIPIPGHTSGATAFLWENSGHRFLFTGDSIILKEGRWVAAVLESSDRDSYIKSLELIRDLDFDVLVPWAATSGHPFHVVTTKAEARRNIAAILQRVRRGEDQ